MTEILEAIDKERLAVNPLLKKKSELGQFLTPSSVAMFMASLFDKNKMTNPKILDAGAGIGSLTSAFIERLVTEQLSDSIVVNVVEIDEILRTRLFSTLSMYEDKINLSYHVIADDFIEWATNALLDEESLFSSTKNRFTHAILNPPYKKILSTSRHRKLLRSVGIETGNLYSAFVALSIELMEEHGQIVVIIPRSFCNGPYFRPFRQFLLEKTAIMHMHLFDSRDKAFKDDEVLQENVIMLLERGAHQNNVKISTSKDDSFVDYKENCYPFEKIVQPKDSEMFIHIPTSNEESFIERFPTVCFSLKEIGVEVSTGPVVDFRVKSHLRDMPEEGTVPLFYPNHFVGTLTEWPKVMKKPNAVYVDEEMKKWLYPNGYYTVVKRFSSKEEKRRIVAGVLTPESVDYTEVGFENGLNVLHFQKQGIAAELAFGLYAYLNSTEVDKYFRVFNGHTQVNATDLRTMKYPSRETLEDFGRWVMSNSDTMGQEEIDQKLEEILMTEGTHSNIEDALEILRALGLPRAQLNERSALCLLAILNLTADKTWSDAENPLIGITPMMEFSRINYGKEYAPNTRETFRRQTMHQFIDAGISLYNPDMPTRAVNSPKAVYQIEPEALMLIRKYGTSEWDTSLEAYLTTNETLIARYAKEREQNRLPVQISPGKEILISHGEHSELIKAIIEDFAPRYVPGGVLIYAGDTGDKLGYFDEDLLNSLGVTVDSHGKMPDVVIYYPDKDWLLLVESVTSHGPVDGKRHDELARLFEESTVGIVYVTAFPNRSIMARYLSVIAWETEVWVADAPSHLIHFNGIRFLGPY